MRVATDVGGTFTDLVCFDADGIRTVKTDTTPPAFERGVLNAIDKAALDPAAFGFFAHGTTVVINALLSRRGARTALITTRGFRDVLEIARGNRPDLFNFAFTKPAPFVPRYLRHEITERIDYRGEVLEAVRLDELPDIVTALKAAEVEAVAVCLLHGYVNPAHEKAVVDRLAELWPDADVIASHGVCREWREYERTSTTDLAAVDAAFDDLAAKVGGTKQDIARGVVRIANANMVNALKLVSLNKGYDPRDFALIAFGGGGAMHAVDLAEQLMVPKVIIPANASVLSAWGMLRTDLRRDFLQTRVSSLDAEHATDIATAYAAIEEEARRLCLDEGMPADGLRVERFADMRYRGQEHTVKVAFPDGAVTADTIAEAITAFHDAHEREYTFRLTNPVELVNYHVVVLAGIDKQPLPERPVTGRPLADARRQPRTVDFDEHGVHRADIYDWALLEPGMSFDGLAVVEDPSTTLVVTPGKRVAMDALGNLHVDMRGSS